MKEEISVHVYVALLFTIGVIAITVASGLYGSKGDEYDYSFSFFMLPAVGPFYIAANLLWFKLLKFSFEPRKSIVVTKYLSILVIGVGLAVFVVRWLDSWVGYLSLDDKLPMILVGAAFVIPALLHLALVAFGKVKVGQYDFDIGLWVSHAAIAIGVGFLTSLFFYHSSQDKLVEYAGVSSAYGFIFSLLGSTFFWLLDRFVSEVRLIKQRKV